MSTVTKDNYHFFTYTNESLLTSAPKGVCIEFHGLNLTGPYAEPEERAKRFADQGIILVKPMTNPWSWMNPQAFSITETIMDILEEKYPQVKGNLALAGGSMGGYEALMYSVYTKRNLLSCTVNCPLCDCEQFRIDDPWRAKTIMCAHYEEGDFDKSLHDHSPINNIDKMPEIKYTVFQCTEDSIIKKEVQADRFVEAAKGKLDIAYYLSAGSEHCELTTDMWDKHDSIIFDSFTR